MLKLQWDLKETFVSLRDSILYLTGLLSGSWQDSWHLFPHQRHRVFQILWICKQSCSLPGPLRRSRKWIKGARKALKNNMSRPGKFQNSCIDLLVHRGHCYRAQKTHQQVPDQTQKPVKSVSPGLTKDQLALTEGNKAICYFDIVQRLYFTGRR